MNTLKTQCFNEKIHKGDIFCANLLNGQGSQHKGVKYVIVFSNNANNIHAPTINVIPLTSQLKKLCVHVEIEGCGLTKKSMALVEQITTINKTQLLYKVGRLSNTYIKQIYEALDIQTGRKLAFN